MTSLKLEDGDKSSNFINYCAEQVQKFDLKPGMIINMDETPIWADMPSATTIESVGAKSAYQNHWPRKTEDHSLPSSQG